MFAIKQETHFETFPEFLSYFEIKYCYCRPVSEELFVERV